MIATAPAPDFAAARASCGRDCEAFVAKWDAWLAARRATRAPLAILDCGLGYEQLLDGKSRNMIRRADSLYRFRSFDYNRQLRAIDAVNASKPQRQGRPMRGWYTEPAQPSTPAQLCSIHRDLWLGGFRRSDGSLAGYCHLAALNGHGVLVSILGAAGATAVINGLVAHAATQLGLRWLNYLHWQAASDSLTAFKQSVGFRPVLLR